MTLKLNAPGGGSVTIDVPTTASNFTLTAPASTGNVVVSPQPVTVPNATGTVMVSGNMPAFSAWANGNQTLTANTWTKITFNNELFDTAGNFDITNYRFTPTVAGYYQINTLITWQASATATYLVTAIYKNGSAFLQSSANQNSVTGVIINSSDVIYMNGSTDYLELFALAGAASQVVNNNNNPYLNRFSGVLVRAA